MWRERGLGWLHSKRGRTIGIDGTHAQLRPVTD